MDAYLPATEMSSERWLQKAWTFPLRCWLCLCSATLTSQEVCCHTAGQQDNSCPGLPTPLVRQALISWQKMIFSCTFRSCSWGSHLAGSAFPYMILSLTCEFRVTPVPEQQIHVDRDLLPGEMATHGRESLEHSQAS